MSTPKESIEALGVQIDRDAAAMAAHVLRLQQIHDRAAGRQMADHAPNPEDPCRASQTA